MPFEVSNVLVSLWCSLEQDGCGLSIDAMQISY